MSASGSDRGGSRHLVEAPEECVRTRGRRASPLALALRARAMFGAIVCAAAIGGCVTAPAESHLTIFNANTHRVTVIIPPGDAASTFSIAACGTAEFRWDGNWRAVSGADAADASEIPVYVYPWVPANEQGPGQVLEVISGARTTEYPAREAPSLSPCIAPSSSAAPSG